MSLIEKLNAHVGKTPDQIVAEITHQIFIRGEFEPWEVPSHLIGREVLIHWSYGGDLEGAEWWRGPGDGSSTNRDRAVPWRIEDAFRRFRGDMYLNNGSYAALHLVPL